MLINIITQIKTVCHTGSVLYCLGYSEKFMECSLIFSTIHLLPLSSHVLPATLHTFNSLCSSRTNLPATPVIP